MSVSDRQSGILKRCRLQPRQSPPVRSNLASTPAADRSHGRTCAIMNLPFSCRDYDRLISLVHQVPAGCLSDAIIMSLKGVCRGIQPVVYLGALSLSAAYLRRDSAGNAKIARVFLCMCNAPSSLEKQRSPKWAFGDDSIQRDWRRISGPFECALKQSCQNGAGERERRGPNRVCKMTT